MQQLKEFIADLQTKMSSVRSKIELMKIRKGELERMGNIPKEYIGNIVPAREGVEIHFPFYPERIQGNLTISGDGPFVATSIHFGFIIPWYSDGGQFDPFFNNAEYLGRWRRISSALNNSINQGGGATAIEYCSCDFYWEYEVSEQHRRRQNIPVPSSMVNLAEYGNGFFPLVPNDTFPKTSTVTIWVTTLGKWNSYMDEYFQHEGTLWCGFSGFYILEDY